MANDLYRAVELLKRAERGAAVNRAVDEMATAAWPTILIELGVGLVLALLLVGLFRSRRGYVPDWAARLFGVRRKLRSRAELKPKPSPLQPPGLHESHVVAAKWFLPPTEHRLNEPATRESSDPAQGGSTG